MKEKIFTFENFFFYIFLLFFIFPINLNAETISTDVTVSADTTPAGTSKTITEDLTVTSSGSLTCTKISNCIHFGDSGLTIDNQGTIKINGSDVDNVIRAANSGDDNSTVNNSGTIVNETGNNAIYYSITDSGYIYNTGTISATTKAYTIRSQDNTNFKIDNYGTITNLSSSGQTIYSRTSSASDTGAIINNYAGGVISAPNNTAGSEKGAFNTYTDDPSVNWTINNWGTITAAYDTMTIGTSYTINNYGTIESTNYDYPAIIPVGNNNTINLYDGTLLIGYIDDGTEDSGGATSGHALNLNFSCSSYDFKVVGGTNYTVKDNSKCSNVVYSGGYARSVSTIFQSTADELLALKTDLINETLDFINNTEENKDEQFGFISKSYTDRENGEAIDKFAVHKKNFVLVEPINSERFNSFETFSLSLDNIKLSNLGVKSTNFQYGFFFNDLNLSKKNKISFKTIFGYNMYDSERTQLNNSVASGKEIIEENYHSFSTIIGTQLSRNYENGYIKINLDKSFERFAQYDEGNDASWDSRLLDQFMGDIIYGWKKEFKNKIFLNPELAFCYRTLIDGEKQEYQVNGSNLTFDKGVQEDGFGKFALKTNYLFSENANLFFNASAKKTTEDQETFSINIGFKNVF
jgi:hypothetical protein